MYFIKHHNGPVPCCLKIKRCSRGEPGKNDGRQGKTHKILKSLMHNIIVLRTTDRQLACIRNKLTELNHRWQQENQSGTRRWHNLTSTNREVVNYLKIQKKCLSFRSRSFMHTLKKCKETGDWKCSRTTYEVSEGCGV